jgi:hypothetical protein
MANALEPGLCCLMDRGYARFTLWSDIHAADSSDVCRVRDNSVYEVIEEKELTEADRKAHATRPEDLHPEILAPSVRASNLLKMRVTNVLFPEDAMRLIESNQKSMFDEPDGK